MKTKERPFGVTSGGEKLAYALGDLGSNFVWTFISSFLTLYYTDSVLMSAGLIGTIMLICRIFDGVSDILMGMLLEKTRTKMGKARPWFGGSIIPLVGIQLLVFNVPGTLSNGAKLGWIIVSYFLLTVVAYTVNNLSYHAMLSRISLTGEDRNKVSSLRGVFAFLAGLILAILTPKLLAGFGGEKVQSAWTTTALVYSLLCLVFETICFFGCREKISCYDEKTEVKKETPDLKAGIRMLLHSKYFYLSVLVFIVTYILNGMTLATSVYYARDVLGSADLYSIIALVDVFAVVIGISISPKLFKKHGKRAVMLAGSCIAIAGCVLGLIGSRNAILVFVATALNGLGLAPYVSGLFTFAPDIIEYFERKSGARYEGLVTAVNSVGIKIGTGLASAFIGWGLAAGHYEGALTVQPASAITAEVILRFAVPIVMSLISIVCMLFWDMDKQLAKKD